MYFFKFKRDFVSYNNCLFDILPGFVGECSDWVRTGNLGFVSQMGLILTHGLNEAVTLKTVHIRIF
jgi:hypothetical protein